MPVASEGPRVARVRLLMLLAVTVIQAANLTYFVLPAQRDMSQSLPLHLCDLAGLLAIAALALPGVRVLAIVLYCWGIGLSTQAFFTPTVPTGPDTLRFHLFFLSHLSIVAPAIFLVTSRLYRPRPMDIVTAFCVTLAYGLAMVALNNATGWNYGYVGKLSTEKPTVIDKLGAWPLRLVWLGCIIMGVYAAIVLPWGRSLARPSVRH